MPRDYKELYEDAMDKVKGLRVQLKKQKESIECMGNSLMSSVGEKGSIVTQIIHFTDGTKKTFRGIIVSTIEQGEMTKFSLEDGRKIYINTKNVNCFETFS